MADHLFDPTIVKELMKFPLDDDEIILAVDGNTHNSLVDMEDVTRVKTKSGKILKIGKGLKDLNGFDTGIFICTPAIFDALEQSARNYGDASLSGAMRVLSANGQAIAVGTRPISMRISHWLVNRRITPNQISLFSFLCSALGAGLFAFGNYSTLLLGFAFGNYSTLLLGGILAQCGSIIDGCDGEVARLKFQSSRNGGWFDAVLDRYADAFLLFGLMWHAYTNNANGLILLTGFLFWQLSVPSC